MRLYKKDIDIPIKSDNINLKGSIYHTSNTPSKAPWIIVLGGYLEHRGSKFVQAFCERFANAGYYVISYDYRGHGETIKVTGKLDFIKATPNIFSDIHEVINWIIETQSSILQDDKIVLFGRSYGGAILLTHGFIDQKAKILIALCTRYDYATVQLKIPNELIKKISPKYFINNNPTNNERILLAHCKDDFRIPFENVLHIKKQLGLKSENILIFETGGHSFKGHRDELFDHIKKFMKKL